jgi:hypothetical protein
MKISTLFIAFMVAMNLYAQFPEPTDFDVDLCYNGMDQMPCAPDLPELSYRMTFTWVAPDTSDIPATLIGYKIYNDNNLIASTDVSPLVINGAVEGSFYITAVYSNPAGESIASNIDQIEGVPININETELHESEDILYDREQQTIELKNFDNAQLIRIIDSNGKILRVEKEKTIINVSELKSGVYIVEIIENDIRKVIRRIVK